MPHSMPVSELITHPHTWPQLRADTTVADAIKILRIMSEDRKLEAGHSTPLVFDDEYKLLGFVRLTDLLKNVRHLCGPGSEACELGKAVTSIRDIMIRFVGSVEGNDSILKALDIMMDHDVSLVPVISAGRFKGIIKLSDIFNTVSALLFDEQDPSERSRLIEDFRLSF